MTMFHGNWDWGWGLGGMYLMGIVWLAFVALVVWLIVRATRPERSWAPPRDDGARDILDRRFAAGEISQQEYTEMRRMLTGR
jgi:putative membrane protein